MITKKQILKKLSEIIDPEVAISIVDLGLIYDIEIKNQKSPKIFVKMTLTTIGCPMAHYFEKEIIDKIKELGVEEKNIKLEFVFDPPWSLERISQKGKKILGI